VQREHLHEEAGNTWLLYFFEGLKRCGGVLAILCFLAPLILI
jgi:hypothetical protein